MLRWPLGTLLWDLCDISANSSAAFTFLALETLSDWPLTPFLKPPIRLNTPLNVSAPFSVIFPYSSKAWVVTHNGFLPHQKRAQKRVLKRGRWASGGAGASYDMDFSSTEWENEQESIEHEATLRIDTWGVGPVSEGWVFAFGGDNMTTTTTTTTRICKKKED